MSTSVRSAEMKRKPVGGRAWRLVEPIAALACLILYTLLWCAWVRSWSWLEALDSPLLTASRTYGVAHPRWVLGWDLFCTVLGPTTFRVIGICVAVVAIVRHRWRDALFLVATIGLSGPLSVLAKAVADRPRPTTHLVDAPSSSFPSGHAVGVMVGVVALMTVLGTTIRGSRRVIAICLGAAVVVAIGVGRVVLNVHHPSDVLAGWALACAYVSLCRLLRENGADEANPR